jgi:hypothetical protein
MIIARQAQIAEHLLEIVSTSEALREEFFTQYHHGASSFLQPHELVLNERPQPPQPPLSEAPLALVPALLRSRAASEERQR